MLLLRLPAQPIGIQFKILESPVLRLPAQPIGIQFKILESPECLRKRTELSPSTICEFRFYFRLMDRPRVVLIPILCSIRLVHPTEIPERRKDAFHIGGCPSTERAHLRRQKFVLHSDAAVEPYSRPVGVSTKRILAGSAQTRRLTSS
jgi:hypothetical protein